MTGRPPGDLVHPVGEVPEHARRDVGVEARSRRGAGVPEDAGSGAEVLSGLEEHRRAGVPEVVPRHVREAEPLAVVVVAPGHVAGVEGGAD